MNSRRFLDIMVACLLIGACDATAQLQPQVADGSVAISKESTLPGPVLESLRAYAGVRAVRVILETEANREDVPVRIEILLDSGRRFSQRVFKRDASGEWDRERGYFSHYDGTHFRARRGTMRMYIQHDAASAWLPSPGPALLAYAPWPMLRLLDGIAKAGVETSQDTCTLRLEDGTTLTFSTDGTLTKWVSTRGTSDTVEYRDFMSTDRDKGQDMPAWPQTIVELPNKPDDKAVTWRVVSCGFNPPVEQFEQEMAFAPLGGEFQRFDPDTGDITNPDGSSGGREIQPAARGIELWEANKKTSAWSALFKWGGIATGLFVVGFVMELIRRRL